MIKLALRSALSDRAADGKIIVVDDWGLERPRTKDAKAALASLGLDRRVLVVIDAFDSPVALSFRNLPEVQLIKSSELNAYDVLCNDWIVFTRAISRRPMTAPSATTPRRHEMTAGADRRRPTRTRPRRRSRATEVGRRRASEVTPEPPSDAQASEPQRHPSMTNPPPSVTPGRERGSRASTARPAPKGPSRAGGERSELGQDVAETSVTEASAASTEDESA